jgi:hypothetical protein
MEDRMLRSYSQFNRFERAVVLEGLTVEVIDDLTYIEREAQEARVHALAKEEQLRLQAEQFAAFTAYRAERTAYWAQILWQDGCDPAAELEAELRQWWHDRFE